MPQVYPQWAMQPLALWTIGHSTHPFDAFARLLAQERIDVVADVRSQPYSRFSPQFGREALAAALRERQLGYVFLGDELGGRPTIDEHYDDQGHALYGPMSREPGFCRGIERILRGARDHRVALMCSEADPQHCHRRLLVGKVLAERGVELRHILRDGSVNVERSVPLDAGGQDALFREDDRWWRSTRSVSRRRRRSASSAA